MLFDARARLRHLLGPVRQQDGQDVRPQGVVHHVPGQVVGQDLTVDGDGRLEQVEMTRPGDVALVSADQAPPLPRHPSAAACRRPTARGSRRAQCRRHSTS